MKENRALPRGEQLLAVAQVNGRGFKETSEEPDVHPQKYISGRLTYFFFEHWHNCYFTSLSGFLPFNHSTNRGVTVHL